MYDEIYNWLRAEAKKRNINAHLYMQQAKQEEKWLHLPVYIIGDDLDAYDRASLLQDLEDSWNDQEPKPNVLLLLIPAARPVGTSNASVTTGPVKS